MRTTHPPNIASCASQPDATRTILLLSMTVGLFFYSSFPTSANATTPADDYCVLDLSLRADIPKTNSCRATPESDEFFRKYPGQVVGIPLGAAGLAVGLVACPLILIADKIANPGGHSGDAGLAYGLFIVGCPFALVHKGHEFGKSLGGAPFIGLKRVTWDCPRAILTSPPRTGTVVGGKIIWDDEMLGMKEIYFENIYKTLATTGKIGTDFRCR